LSELAQTDTNKPLAVSVAIEETGDAMTEIDAQFDSLKLKIDAGHSELAVSPEELTQATERFRAVLAGYQVKIEELLADDGLDRSAEAKLEDVVDILENELSIEQERVTEGFFIELVGAVDQNGLFNTTDSSSVGILDLPADMFVGQIIKVEGVLLKGELRAREIKSGDIKLVTNAQDGTIEFRAEAIVQQDSNGYFIEQNGVTIRLRGALTSNLAGVVGLLVELRGILNTDDGGVVVSRLKSLDDDTIDVRDSSVDGDNEDGGDDSDDSGRSGGDSEDNRDDSDEDDDQDVTSPPANNESEDDADEREAEGVLTLSGGKYKVTDEDGVSYTLQYGGSLASFVGKDVRVKGTLVNVATKTLAVSEIRLD
jgi:hypothetical protein